MLYSRIASLFKFCEVTEKAKMQTKKSIIIYSIIIKNIYVSLIKYYISQFWNKILYSRISSLFNFCEVTENSSGFTQVPRK